VDTRDGGQAYDRVRSLPVDQWPRVKALFFEALEHPAPQRTAFLREQCGEDAVLLGTIAALLDSDRAAKSFMEEPAGPWRDGISASRATRTGASRDGDFARLDLGVTRGSGTPQYMEIRELLRRRLSMASVIALGVTGVFYAMRFLRHDFTPLAIWRTMVPGALYLAFLAVLAGILWRKRVYPLSQLRVCEAVFFGAATLFLLGETYNPLFVEPAWLITYASRHPAEMSILAREPSIFWMVLIIMYGTFIPNTGRRCAAVVGSVALCPLIVVAVGGALHAIPPRSLLLFLSEMALWVGCAAAMAIYGSQKIAVLREEALAARKLGQYQLKQRLGQGGMGDVYLAEHVLLKRPCAVKVIRLEQAGNPAVLERFLREVQVTATLTHPNTVQVFDYGQTQDGVVFYAMEYLIGLSLEQLVTRHGPLSPPRVIFVLRQLCGALAEAHGIGLIHRDIKPSNVILCERGGLHDVAKLLDFGLVRMPSADGPGAAFTQAGLIFGTPGYMSPEQAAGEKTLDARSDTYSLGALAYFLATGRPPFVRDSIVQTLAAHINEPVPPPRNWCPELPEDLEAVLLRCLAKDPGARFSDVTTLERALGVCRQAGAWTQSDAAAWWRTVPIDIESQETIGAA